MYAREIENQLIEPTAAEFAGVPNWQTNEPLLRKRGYLPVVGSAEPREGFVAKPSEWHTVEQSETRIEPRQFEEDVYEPDPETGEPVKTGTRMVMRDMEVEFDTSYIQIDDWIYEQIPTPEPPDTTERDNAERAIVLSIVKLAQKYYALQDLIAMEDITIPNLQALATGKGVSLEDWTALISEITPMKWQLEAVVGGTWAECWDGLKSRFKSYFEEIQALL